MKFFILQFLFYYGICYEHLIDYRDSDLFSSEEVVSIDPEPEPNPKNCTTMKFGCESCTNLVMCIDTDYGFMKQYVTCPSGTSCLKNQCTTERNPFCDGTAVIPFKCHVPGMYPDPFDCTKYHFCVPKSYEIVNHTMRLMHYEHFCQEDDTGVQYMYDPKSTYCKVKLEDGCKEWPVPLCPHEGFSDALKDNKSLFYVCDLVEGHLYPHLYVCPHGEEYNNRTTKCDISPRIFDHSPREKSFDEMEISHGFYG